MPPSARKSHASVRPTAVGSTPPAASMMVGITRKPAPTAETAMIAQASRQAAERHRSCSCGGGGGGGSEGEGAGSGRGVNSLESRRAIGPRSGSVVAGILAAGPRGWQAAQFSGSAF
eukprot:scaffold14219_cov59-Phaeocystis_antarctica.AAC.1